MVSLHQFPTATAIKGAYSVTAASNAAQKSSSMPLNPLKSAVVITVNRFAARLSHPLDQQSSHATKSRGSNSHIGVFRRAHRLQFGNQNQTIALIAAAEFNI